MTTMVLVKCKLQRLDEMQCAQS